LSRLFFSPQFDEPPIHYFVQANFASYLTVQAFKYPITSIEELAIKNKLNYVITSGGATETYFLNSLDPVILALRPRLRVRRWGFNTLPAWGL
jgi:hypothetical protein